MPVKFARQAWLNTAVSWNHGTFKFVVTKKAKQSLYSTFMIRDCSQQISLEFDPLTSTVAYAKNRKDVRARAARNRKHINEIRKKVTRLVDGVVGWGAAMHQALDEQEAELEAEIAEWVPVKPYADRSAIVLADLNGD